MSASEDHLVQQELETLRQRVADLENQLQICRADLAYVEKECREDLRWANEDLRACQEGR